MFRLIPRCGTRRNSVKLPVMRPSRDRLRAARTGSGQAITKNFKNGERVRHLAVNPFGNE
jgi:hypothetical protein